MTTDLRAAALRKCRESTLTTAQFFEENVERIVACARDVAAALEGGGRLMTLGNGGSACDAVHAAVEFMHPIFEKRTAFPALALPLDSALMSAVGNDQDFALGFAHQVELLGRRGDVVLAISTSGQSANVIRALRVARPRGMLTVGFSGKDGGKMSELCDHSFVVKSYSIHRIQEVHATLIHVLWDLVHVTRGEEDVL